MTPTPTNASGNLFSASFISLLCINILSALAFNLVAPVLAEHVLLLGGSLGMAGLVVGAFAITALFVGPFGGVLTDRLRKKHLLIAVTLLNGFATLAYAFAPNMHVLLLCRILHGAGFSIAVTANIGWITDFIPQHRLGEGIGYYGMSQIVATAIGPNIGIWASSLAGTSSTFLIAAMALLIAAIAMTQIQEKLSPTQTSRPASPITFRDIVALEILPLSLIGGLFSLGNGLVASFLVLLGKERGIAGIGAYFALNALFLFFTRPVAGKIYDRKGLTVIMYPALLCGVVEALLLGHATTLWMIVLAAIIKAFGQGVAQPALQAESIRHLGQQRRGVASSTFYIGANIGQGIGPILGGFILNSWGYTTMFNTQAGLMLTGMAAYAWLQSRQTKNLTTGSNGHN